MKIKKTALIFAFVLTLLFSGCAGKNNAQGDEKTKDIGEEQASLRISENKYSEYNLDEYMTLAQYKGVEIKKQDPTVTDEQYDQYVKSVLSKNSKKKEITDRTVREGDTVRIDYTGKMDEMETPEGMTAQDQEIVIGAGAYIPGFEEGLVGAGKGDVVTVNVTFPDPYLNNEALSGQKATFTITVDAIYEIITPELTDDFVKTISDYTTVDEYKSSVMLDLYTQNVESAQAAQKNELWQKIIDNTTIIKYPDNELEAYSDEMIKYYTDYAVEQGFESLDAMLAEYYNTTLEEFKKEALSYAQKAVADEMILYSIVQKEDLFLTQGEYEAGAQRYVEMEQAESLAALEEQYGKDIIIRSVLWDKTIDYLLSKAVEV